MLYSSQINKDAPPGVTSTVAGLTNTGKVIPMSLPAIVTSAAPRVNPAPGFPWFAGTDGTTAERIQIAAARYFEKFGLHPTVCYMNPQDFDGTLHIFVRAETHIGMKPGMLYLTAEHEPVVEQPQQPAHVTEAPTSAEAWGDEADVNYHDDVPAWAEVVA